MRNRWSRLVLLALCSIAAAALTLSCQSPAQTTVPTPAPTTTPNQCPADIKGTVLIVGFLSAQATVYNPPADQTFWVVDITFINTNFELPDISSYDHWNVVAGTTYYWVPDVLKAEKQPTVFAPVGQIEKKVVCFQVPASLKLSDARLYYQAQKIVAFGPLTGGQKAAGYDWDLKTIVNK